jgi:hypothetical protein
MKHTHTKTKYRIVSYTAPDVKVYYYIQRKGWFFWHTLFTGWLEGTYFYSFENAKNALENYKKYKNKDNNPEVLWED